MGLRELSGGVLNDVSGVESASHGVSADEYGNWLRLRTLRIVLPNVAKHLVEVTVCVNHAGPSVEFVDSPAATETFHIGFGCPSVKLADREALFLGYCLNLLPNLVPNRHAVSHSGL